MSSLLQGKVAVVYGGTGGIGAATAARLARAGARVIVVGQRDEDKARRVASECPARGIAA